MPTEDYSEYHGIRALSMQDAFAIAASNSLIEEMQLLLDDGVDIDGIASYSKSTALCTAAGRGVMKAIEFLLKKGAALDVPGAHDLTPLMHACSFGKSKGSKAALRLIEAGADVNAVRASDDMTALKFAVGDCKPEVITALIEHGAEVDGPKGTDQTALMIAARANNVDALRILVENGADTSLPCKLPWAEKRNALGLATLEKRKKAIDYLATVTPG